MNRKALFLALCLSSASVAALVACGSGEDAVPVAVPTPPPPGPPLTGPFEINVAAPPSATPSGVTPKLTVFATGLASPWGMAFLPDGQLLVTQKMGTLVKISADGQTISTVGGVPEVDSREQGGLLDVAVDPQFETNNRIYLTYSEPVVAGTTNRTSVARAELTAAGDMLENVTIIFRQSPEKQSTGHYGSRLVFRGDGTLFVTLGERLHFGSEAQSLESQLGKVVRINTDGSIPTDNPYYLMGGNAAAVWSYGHRNPQAAALNPATGDLWVTEHGPQGGDEVNLALPTRNFGWPNVSYGCSYGAPQGSACRLGGGVHNPPYAPPLVFWHPVSTAPGGAAFYTGSKFPEWQGSFFVGGLAGKTLWRLVPNANGTAIVGVEPFFSGLHEIRDLKQGPDGCLYMISRNNNQILRIDR